MTRTITFLPSGRSSPIEANESVLEACLRAGLTPLYGCSNGNCGECKAILKSGEIEQIRHSDHAFTLSEKANGSFLMCANRALGDIVIEADVTQGPDDVPLQSIDTKVKAIEFLDPQVARLHLQTPRSRRLRFISGQSVTLTMSGGIQRKQAVASCPCDDRNLHFHVPHIPGDAFSEAIFDGDLAVRETIHLEGPFGNSFFLDESDKRPSLFLCWHTGFAPIISLIEHAMSLDVEKDIHLFRFSPTPDHQYLPNLGRAWADAYDNVFANLMSQRITLLSNQSYCEEAISAVAAQFADLSDLNVYVAGPPDFVEATHTVFTRLGMGKDRIKTHTDWLGIV
ncbi:2Fe-2S iron-sulfur cluster-binding protein [Alisedimentitalea sp. MJ-SS2]|uniref:2Fe-2S iron-sulfur cluster-binding protein n=1 Tax=Aliisedimentitalea sp. MJ-SS2 TaxID=3049795 RepID=UPI00291349C6|nr:2Fe-2S iron-sulfur cluster-binding protein [Alisedimentitalea sp. MJ-SS2]MDU8929961.1 2Fe-2S iron-sulfur cluster-binding protein [Alisedimentitalea sp. MJ-SS2]